MQKIDRDILNCIADVWFKPYMSSCDMYLMQVDKLILTVVGHPNLLLEQTAEISLLFKDDIFISHSFLRANIDSILDGHKIILKVKPEADRYAIMSYFRIKGYLK